VSQRPGSIMPLLGDLSQVPADYIRDVSHTKRFLERWEMDPAFRTAYQADPDAAIASLGICLRPEQVLPLIDEEKFAEARGRASRQGEEGQEGSFPLSVLRHLAFINEKVRARSEIREEGESTNSPRLAAWRRRQIRRCVGELGQGRADSLVHAPAAVELAKGCSVGCWFCGVAAPKFEHTWPYTEDNAELWRGVLSVLNEVVGVSARQAFLYWATDPLDNPDYEHFLVDFYQIMGRCPQTTSALGPKDVERTRRLLELVQSMGSQIDRFSIIATNSLYRLHEAFTPEELLRVEFVPQTRESSEMKYRKAHAGRARKFTKKREKELVTADEASTIACVSGFLFNMVERSVRLITPCAASDRWPLGYWVVDHGTFDTPAELRNLLTGMISRLKVSLGVRDVVRLRPDVRVEVDQNTIRLCSRGSTLAIAGVPDIDDLAALLVDGSQTVEGIALRREKTASVPLEATFTVLDHVFSEGLLDEEPPAQQAAEPVPVAISAGPR
jgi:radical SAM family RiPP maturation amino acid epimerase